MKALLDATRVELPRALLDMEIDRLMRNMRHDLEARGLKADKVPMHREAFEAEAQRRVSLGLILAELVKKHGLEAKPEQIKAVVGEYAQSYEKPEEVVRWYYQSPDRLREVESIVVEDNVVQWVLANARVEDKATEFDDLMGMQNDLDARPDNQRAARPGVDTHGHRAERPRRARLRHLLAAAQGARGVSGWAGQRNVGEFDCGAIAFS
jgi:FKBP-type peptidyl-prolyl cis-trans isomerase (trigger factor)